MIKSKGMGSGEIFSDFGYEFDDQLDKRLRLQSLLVSFAELCILGVFCVKGGKAVVAHEPSNYICSR